MSEESVYERRGLIAIDRRQSPRDTSDRRRGRPVLSPGEPTEGVSVRMPASLYDRLYHKASESRQTVSEFIRESLGKVV